MRSSSRKTCQLQIRVTPEEKNRIEREAKRHNLNVSDWIIQSSIGNDFSEIEQLYKQLKVKKWRRHSLAALHDCLVDISGTELSQFPVPSNKISLLDLNYLAALIETASHQKQAPPPEWVSKVPPLPVPHFATKIPSLRIHLLTKSPPSFKKRNLFVDTTLGDRI